MIKKIQTIASIRFVTFNGDFSTSNICHTYRTISKWVTARASDWSSRPKSWFLYLICAPWNVSAHRVTFRPARSTHSRRDCHRPKRREFYHLPSRAAPFPAMNPHLLVPQWIYHTRHIDGAGYDAMIECIFQATLPITTVDAIFARTSASISDSRASLFFR